MAGTTNNAGTAALKAVGKIDKASGTVEVVHPDGTHDVLHVGDLVYKGDVVSTNGDGAVGITFADSSTFSLGKSGRMTIDELVYDPDSQSGQSALSVVKGAFSFASGQIAKTAPDAAILKTPVMTIGIRGTTVAGQAGGEGEENSVVLLQDADGGTGQVVISNSGGSMVLSSANNFVQLFSSYQPPPPPAYMSPTQVQSLYGGATDSRPPSPPAGTPPQQIVPNFQPSAPPPQQQNTPQPEQHGSTTNLDSPITGHQSQVGEQTQTGNGGNTTTTLVDLINIQNNVARNANAAGANIPETQQGEQTVQEQLTQTAEQTQQQIEQQASLGNNGTTTDGANNSSNDDAVRPDNGNNGHNTPTPNGRAIDGYVANATVFRDMDNDGVLDSGEASATTDSSGRYYLAGSGGVIVVLKGGNSIDTTTGEPLTFTMKAPAGSDVVTPLTTLVVTIAQSIGLEAAKTRVADMLGLSEESLTTLDPVGSLGSSAEANQVMAAIAKIVATVNTVSALTTTGTTVGISASEMMDFLALTIRNNTDPDFNLATTLADPVLLRQLLAQAPNISNYLNESQLTQFSESLASSNQNLTEAITDATSYSQVSSRINESTSTDGALVTATKNIVEGDWNTADLDVVFGDGTSANPGILSQLKAAGITTLTFSSGTSPKYISASQAAGLEVTLNGGVELKVQDTGANLTQYVGSISAGFTAVILTSGEFHLDREELANLHSIMTKSGGTIVCDLAGTESLTEALYSDLGNMLATADRIDIAAGATVTLGISVLTSGEPLSLGANAKIIALVESGDNDLTGATNLTIATTLKVAADTTVTLNPTQWAFYTATGHAMVRQDSSTSLFQLEGTGDLTGLDLSQCDQLIVGLSNATLTLAQWDALGGISNISFDEAGGKIDLTISADANLTASHHEFATFVANGMISSLTVEADTEVTLDAATLLGWLNSGRVVTLSEDADITVQGDISGFEPNYTDYLVYFDHVTTNSPPTADPAALFTVPSGGGTLTIDASDLDGNNLTYEVSGASRGGILVPIGNGQFTYIPPQDTGGADTFTVTISDGTHSITQEIAVLVTNGAGSPGFTANIPPDLIEIALPGEWVDTDISLTADTVAADAQVTVVVYLSDEGDNNSGTLRVGGDQVGALWTMTGTITEINAQLAELQYQSPTTITADGRDYIHVTLYNDGKEDTVGYSAKYYAPNVFTGESGTAWSDSSNWSAGQPDAYSVVLIDADNIENLDDKAVVDGSSTAQNTVLVKNGATLEVQGTLGLVGTSSVDAASHLVVSGSGELSNDGTLNLSGDVTIEAGATFDNYGTIEIGGQADEANNGSGFATVTVTVADTGEIAFDQDSSIVLEIGGDNNSPSHDQLVFASDNVALNGHILVNLDPLGGYLHSPTELELISGVSDIQGATFGLTDNSNDHGVVGIVYDANLHTLTARVESFGDGETATYVCGTGQDFVFGAADLQNSISAIENSDQVTGGDLDDTFTVGDNGSWSIDGGNGDDTLRLAAGYNYVLDGTQVAGIEIFDVGAGTVNLTLDHETTATVTNIGSGDAIQAGAEEDTFVVTSGDFSTIAGGAGTDTIVANGSDIYLAESTKVSGVERLEINTAEDTEAVRLSLDAFSVFYMNDNHTVTVSYNGGSHTDDLFLYGTWSSGAYGGGDMTFTSTYSSQTTTVTVDIPDVSHALVAANMMGSDGTHVKVVALSGSDAAVWNADTGIDYIRGADLHSNIIGEIGFGDYVYGGSQNDTFTITSDALATIAGGDGTDTMVLTANSYDFTDPSGPLSSIEKLVLNDANDYDVVNVSLSAESVDAMTGGNGLSVSFYGSSYYDDLHLTGEWSMGTNGATQMAFSASGTTVDVEIPSDGNTLIGASTLPGDGYHVTSATAVNGVVSYYANSDGTDTIIGAANAQNDISGIGADDTVYGGTQDDIFTIISQTFANIQGGGSNDSDTLKVDVSGFVDLTSLGVAGIENIDLTLNFGDIKLDGTTVANLNGNSAVTIMGDSDNTLYLLGNWTEDAGNSGNGYTAYTDGSNNLLVQDEVTVTVSA